MHIRILICILTICFSSTFLPLAHATTKTKSHASDGIYASAKILASAQTNWSNMTITETGGPSSTNINDNWTNVTLGLGVALGYDFYKHYDVPVRLDLEYTMRNKWRGNSDINFMAQNFEYQSSMNLQTLMLSGYYDFYNNSRFTPYIMAGIGVAFLDAQIGIRGDQNNSITHYASLLSPAWQIGAGVGIELTPNVTLDLGYKFLSFANFNYEIENFFEIGKSETDSSFVNIGNAHEIVLGIRYTFGGENSGEDSEKTTSLGKPSSGVYVGAKILGANQTNWSDMEFNDTATGKTIPFSDSWSQVVFGAAINLGYDLYPRYDVPVRLDIEYAMRKQWQGNANVEVNYASVSTVEIVNKLNVNTLMLNAFYDFHNSSRFTPYVMAGAGLAFINSNIEVKEGTQGLSSTENFTQFAWQVGAGVGIEITPRVTLDIGYKYLNFGAFDYAVENFVTAMGPSYRNTDLSNVGSAHEIAVGLRYTF